MLGFDLGVNFNRPYFSSNINEFWKRWHISLSSWLREYLYIPLGGNRNGSFRTYFNLLLTMLIGGLWHGASWHFVMWGAIHGVYLMVYKFISPKMSSMESATKFPKGIITLLSIVSVYILTCFTWIFFRSTSIGDAICVIRKIIIFDGIGISDLPNKFDAMKGFSLIIFVVIIESLGMIPGINDMLRRNPILNYFMSIIALWLIALFGTFTGNSFIYFQF
jgi:alginate O-acetyltransferase complex protein AlgI